MQSQSYIDSHCHLLDPRLDGHREEILLRAKATGITGFFLGGVDPEDWSRQLLFNPEDFKVYRSFGMHPYFVAGNTSQACQNTLKNLEDKLSAADAIGEIGLDLRSNFKSSEVLQREMFERQLKLSKKLQKPVVLHIVRAHEPSLNLLKTEKTEKSMMVHAFNADKNKAKAYLDLGLYLSIGGAVTFANNIALQDAVSYMPLDRLMVESDTPDQAPEGWPGQYNEPSSIINVAAKIAALKNKSTEEILAISKHNLESFLGVCIGR